METSDLNPINGHHPSDPTGHRFRLLNVRVAPLRSAAQDKQRHDIYHDNDPKVGWYPAAHLAPLRRSEWVVYAKRPFGGPQAVLAYLSRYTHRVAIANSRLIACDRSGVTFRWKDYRAEGRDRQKVMTLATGEFIRRFLIHVLPHGFHRIRHYGLLASGTRADNIARARRLLEVPAAQLQAGDNSCAETTEAKPNACPCCGGRMIIIETFQRGYPPRSRPAASPAVIRIDTS
jgi:hypothetical protein